MIEPLKRVPKWAWIASGGVVIGVAAIRFVKPGERVDTSKNEDATAAADMSNVQYDPYTGLPMQSAGGSYGVIVPPVIESGGGGSQADTVATSILPMLLDQNKVFLEAILATRPPASETTQQVPAAAAPAVAPVSAPAPAAPAQPVCSGAFPHWNPQRNMCYRVKLYRRSDGYCFDQHEYTNGFSVYMNKRKC